MNESGLVGFALLRSSFAPVMGALVLSSRP
jgi:hypothetical protein